MAILKDSGMRGTVTALLVHKPDTDGITSDPINSVKVTYAGFEGESHSGLTRKSCVRVKRQYAEGTEIRNTRQISIVSDEELQAIAESLDIEVLPPEWLGATLSLAGIPDFTKLPPSTRLLFNGGVSLVIDMENEPCFHPGNVISSHHPDKGKLFVKHATGRRGVTAWVEREGALTSGESVAVHVPTIQPHPLLAG